MCARVNAPVYVCTRMCMRGGGEGMRERPVPSLRFSCNPELVSSVEGCLRLVLEAVATSSLRSADGLQAPPWSPAPWSHLTPRETEAQRSEATRQGLNPALAAPTRSLRDSHPGILYIPEHEGRPRGARAAVGLQLRGFACTS